MLGCRANQACQYILEKTGLKSKNIVKKGTPTVSGTPLIIEVPGWYINFQAAVIKQLPRPGQITQSMAEGWTDEQDTLKEVLQMRLCTPEQEQTRQAAPVESTDMSAQAGKFALLVNLGIITVPDDYDHASRLSMFSKQNRKKFYYYNDEITDKNFLNPTRALKPGDKLRVLVFEQVVGGNTTSEERMAFLATQKAVYTGAQGASLVFDQKRDQLPKGKWYTSFDKPERLWKDADGYHGVPYVDRHSDGDFRFSLGSFEIDWSDDDCLLCFCDLPSGA